MKSTKSNHTRVLFVLAIVLLFSAAPVLSKDQQLDKAVQEVEKSTANHVQVLTNLLAKVPDSAKPSIEHAIAVSQRSKNIAVEAAELSQTNDPLQKAALHRKNAEKRISEMQAAQRKGKPEFAEELAADYGNSIDGAQKEIAKAKAQGKNIDKESVALEQSTSRHTQVLTALLNRAPEQARKGLTRALEASQHGKHRELGAIKQTERAKSTTAKPNTTVGQKKQRNAQKQTNENRQTRKSKQNSKGKAVKGKDR